MNKKNIFKRILLLLLITLLILEVTGYLFRSYRSGKLLTWEDSGENKYDPWSQWIPSWSFDENSGFRKTIFNPTQVDSCKTIWMFGGSTMVGFTDNDSLRIPSLVSKNVQKEFPNHKIKFINWGVSGYNSQQEIRLFINLLTKFDKPDAVVFYDGGNDIATQLTYENVSAHFYWEMFDNVTSFGVFLPFAKSIYYAYMNSNIYYIYFMGKKFISYKDENKFNKIVEDASKSYFKHTQVVSNICKSMGIKSSFILQPFLMAEKEPTNEAEKSIWNSKPSSYKKFVQNYYSGIRSSMKNLDGFFDLSYCFVNRKEQVYRDPIHLYDSARKIVSDSIYTKLKPMISSLGD